MVKKHPATSTKSTERRATWKGSISFGLVTLSVEAFNFLNRQGGDIHFHQLHAKCHSQIHYQKVCPIHGEVSKDEIVSGYEYDKGKYVEIEPEQLDALRTHEERTLTIDAFVSPEEIDPVYFDGRMYYLLPATKSAQEAYVVMVSALERENRYGVGQVVFSGKEQIAIVRPVKNILHMAMLNYSAEIMSPDRLGSDLKKPTHLDRQLKLAQSMIQNWSNSDFDFSEYKDTYRDKVQKLIAAKVKGKKVVIPKETEPPPKAISLMDALKKSVERAKKERVDSPKTRKSRTA